MSSVYGSGPPELAVSDAAEGATLAELAEWIAYLRADGAPDHAPVQVRVNLRGGLKGARVLTGSQLARSLHRRARRAGHTRPDEPDEGISHV